MPLDSTLQDPASPPSIPSFDDFVASKQSAAAGVRPALTWGAPRSGHRHQGQDFSGPMDSDVGSADDGEVTFAGPNGNMGNAVKVKHPSGIVSVYGHLNKINVQQGDRVKAGASIGLLGQTGNARGPHVHFETYQNDLPIDPAGTSLKPRIGAGTSATEGTATQQPSPQIPKFDDWVQSRQSTQPVPEQQGKRVEFGPMYPSDDDLQKALGPLYGKKDAYQLRYDENASRYWVEPGAQAGSFPDASKALMQQPEAQPLKTPKTSVTLGEGVTDESQTATAPVKPIEFQQGSSMPRNAGPTELMMRPFDEAPKGTIEDQLTQQRYKTPPSTELGTAVKIPFSPHLNPTHDDIVKGYLNSLGPEYAKYGEQYKQQTGRDIVSLGPGDVDRDPEGNLYVKPTRAAVDILNAYVQSGGKLEAAQAEGARIAQERRGAATTAEQQAAPDIADVLAERKERGTENAATRAIGDPTERFVAGLGKMAGGLTSLGGLKPNQVSNYLNTRSTVFESGASLPPLTEQGKEIQRGVPEKVAAALGDLGYSVFEIVALKRVTGLSTGQVMALEAALKDSDEPSPQRAAKTAQAYAMGEILDGHLNRAMSSAMFAVPTGVESAQQVARGQMSKEDAILNTAVQGGMGAILGGGKESDYRTPEVQARESLGIERAPTVPNFDQVIANREDAVKPTIDAIPEQGLVKPPAPPTISRAAEPDAGDKQFRGMNDEQLQALATQRTAKGTTRAQRRVLAQQQADAQAELQRRGNQPPLEPVNPPSAGETKPTDEVPSFQDYVENRPGGGIRFDSLAPDSPEMNQLVSEYAARYGTKEQRAQPASAPADKAVQPINQPADVAPQREAAPSSKGDPIRHAIQNYIDETGQPIDQITSDPDSRDHRDNTAATAEMIQDRLSAQGHDADYGKIVSALYDARDEALGGKNPVQTYEDWQKQQDAKPKPPAKELKPVPALTMGRESQSVTERGSEISSRYAVVNLDDLITSHDSALNANPDFPAELQPRERDRAASADQVSRIASNLRPEFLGESPKASEGAPIVGPDGVVESGNGRVLGLRQAYESNNRGSQSYRRFLLDNAEKFGLDPAAIKDAKSPVLVRVRTTEVDRPKFVREANEQSISSMSPREQARSDARSLKGPLLDLFQPSDSGDIASAGNLPFVRAFMKDVVGPNEVNRYVTSSGHISQEGISRIRNAVFARAYGDSPEGLIALEKIAEDPDNNVRNLTTAMLRNAGGFASLKEGIDQNTRYPLDLAPDISAAMSKLSHLRERGMPVNDYLNQGALYGNDLSPLQRRLLQVFDENKRGANIIDGILKNYLRGADAAGSPTQEGLFGDAYIPSKDDFLEAAIKEAIDGQTVSRSLFATQDQGIQTEPATSENDSPANAPTATREQPRLESESREDTRIAKPTADQGSDNPVKRFDSTIDLLKEQEQQARERLTERGAQAEELFSNQERGATSIPQDIYDYVVIGASKLAQRSLSVAQFVDEMVREFGAAIRSRAREIFKLSRKMVTDTRYKPDRRFQP